MVDSRPTVSLRFFARCRMALTAWRRLCLEALRLCLASQRSILLSGIFDLIATGAPLSFLSTLGPPLSAPDPELPIVLEAIRKVEACIVGVLLNRRAHRPSDALRFWRVRLSAWNV